MLSIDKIDSLIIGLVIGSGLMGYMMGKPLQKAYNTEYASVLCIEHVTVDNDAECSLFTFQGATYATEFAPIIYTEAKG